MGSVIDRQPRARQSETTATSRLVYELSGWLVLARPSFADRGGAVIVLTVFAQISAAREQKRRAPGQRQGATGSHRQTGPRTLA
jgi:hypothetical protein